MNRTRWYRLFCVFIGLSLVFLKTVQGQQRIVFSQYMFHGLSINPAYTGSDDFLNLSLQSRNQWIGLEGAPTYQLLTAHSPLKHKKHVGLGFVAERQQVGVTDLYSFYGTYAYKINVGAGVLALGLQGGVVSYQQQLTQLSTGTPVQDPNFAQDISLLQPNFGTGLYFQTDRYYLGFSVPYLIQNAENNPEGVMIVEQNRHYFLSGGYLFTLSPNVKLKPNFIIQAVDGVPLNANINVNTLIRDVLWLGLSYRSNETYTSLVEVLMNKRLSFGLSYDFTTTNLNQVNNGSVELFLNYRLVKDVPDRIVSPRYF